MRRHQRETQEDDTQFGKHLEVLSYLYVYSSLCFLIKVSVQFWAHMT